MPRPPSLRTTASKFVSLHPHSRTPSCGPDLRDGEVRFPVLLQRGPALPAARSSSHGVFRFAGVSFLSRLPGYPPPQPSPDGIIDSVTEASVPADSPGPGSIMSLSHHSSWPGSRLRLFFLSAVSDTTVPFFSVFQSVHFSLYMDFSWLILWARSTRLPGCRKQIGRKYRRCVTDGSHWRGLLIIHIVGSV